MNTTIFLLVLSLSTISLPLTSNGCPNVRIMGVEDACHRVSGKSASMYHLCMYTLLSAETPETNEVTLYALIAAKLAVFSHENTISMGDRLLKNGTLPATARAAVSGCVNDYVSSRQSLKNVMDGLGNCSFGNLKKDYVDAAAAVEDCTRRLLPIRTSMAPLFGQNMGDRNKTMLAYGLGNLVVRWYV